MRETNSIGCKKIQKTNTVSGTDQRVSQIIWDAHEWIKCSFFVMHTTEIPVLDFQKEFSILGGYLITTEIKLSCMIG